MLAHSDLAVLVALNVVSLSLSETPQPKNPPAPNDVSFLESKDVLLQMLEKKLKEIKDNKKQKESKNGDVLPKNVDFVLKSNGISAVGETELLLRHGKDGQGTVNLTADGISNAGRIQLAIGLGDNGIKIPGLSNLFAGLTQRSEDSNNQNQLRLIDAANLGFRRQTNVSNTDKVGISTTATGVIEAKKEAIVAIDINTAKADTINAVNGNALIASSQVASALQSSAVSGIPIVSIKPAMLTVPAGIVASNGQAVNSV